MGPRLLLPKVLGFVFVTAALGCSRQGVERQRLPDGSYAFTCRQGLSTCLSHVDEVCKGGPYEVLSGHEESKMYGSDDYQVEGHRSRAVVRCLHPGQSPSVAHAPSARASAAPRAVPVKASTSPAPARVCVPGTTQTCVGPAACSGGQACLADGTGFAPCDCGTTAPSSAAPVTSDR